MPSSVWMPTRVLEIIHFSARLSLRLRQTADIAVEPFVALSYCWGGTQQVSTTNENCLRHMTAINLNDLPQTLRDAVTVTHRCNIKFLWVDVLCIIQDDEADKAWEIANMALVYANATIVLSASRARSADEGFLGPRIPMGTDKPQETFELPIYNTSGNLGNVILVPKVRKPNEPIDERAWTLQERILATRCLEFGTLQTRWVCLGCDSKSPPPVDGWVSKSQQDDDTYGEALSAFHRLGTSFHGSVTSPTRVRKLWRSIVNMQSHRVTALEQDRLPSLAGIAERFSAVLDDDYVCGFWKCGLRSEILWRPSHNGSITIIPTSYIAPSWSWAAMNSPVSTYEVMEQNLDPIFQVKRFEIKLGDKRSPFGALRSGWLAIEGCVQSVLWNPHEGSITPTSENAPNEVSKISYDPDRPEVEKLQHGRSLVHLFLLLVEIRRSGDGKWKRISLNGLALAQNSDGQYLRKGYFHHSALVNENVDFENVLRWFYSSKPEQLKIF